MDSIAGSPVANFLSSSFSYTGRICRMWSRGSACSFVRLGRKACPHLMPIWHQILFSVKRSPVAQPALCCDRDLVANSADDAPV